MLDEIDDDSSDEFDNYLESLNETGNSFSALAIISNLKIILYIILYIMRIMKDIQSFCSANRLICLFGVVVLALAIGSYSTNKGWYYGWNEQF